MRTLCFMGFTLLLCSVHVSGTPADYKPGGSTNIDWKRDIDAMQLEMPRHHKNLFHTMTRAQFDSALERLKAKLPQLTDSQVAVEITHIGSMIHDAHSGVDAIPPRLSSRWLPIKFYWYSDAIAVQSAAPRYANLLGGRLIAVDGMPVDEVMQRIAAVTDASNAMTQRDFAPFRLSRPDLLAAIGVVKNPDRVVLTLDIGGSTRMVTISPLPRKADGAPEREGIWLYQGPAPGSTWVDAVSEKDRPMWLKDQTNPYWMQEIPERNALYVQCNFVLNRDGGETFAKFFDRVAGIVDEKKYDRLVLDLRLNGGGDNSLLLPVIHRFIRSEQINRKGHFLVLIGRRTQSAAQNFVNLLEVHTNAVFVGEPTGESPNHYGDPEAIKLPTSEITINLSTLWWQDVAPNDARDATAPSIAIGLSREDYSRGRDPALQVALTTSSSP